MKDKILLIGGGVAGLAGALALNAKGFNVTILDRDEAVPETLTPPTSWDWKRGGAPQVRQPHFFMGRLRNLLHKNYPDLIEDLFAAGVWELPFADTLHPDARGSYRPELGDKDMTPFCARRTTFEMVLRSFILKHGIAHIRSGCRVDDLIIENIPGGRKVVGCNVVVGGQVEEVRADVVIDTSGRGSHLVARLRAAGITIREEHYRSEMVYNTRHYRLREGKSFPPMNGYPGSDFPDFFVGALPADNGTFTVTWGVWKDDPIMAPAARNSEVFERVCRRVPKTRPWIDSERSEPLSDVISFANLDFLWRSLISNGEPQVLNFFMAGDAMIRSNPKFGRGCTWGTVMLHHLANILATELDSRARLVRFEQVLRDEFRADWEAMLKVEKTSRAKFEAEIGLRRNSVGLKLASRLEQHILNVSMLANSRVQRAVMRGYHGLDGVTDWIRDPKIWMAIASTLRPSAKLKALKRANVDRPSRAEIQELAMR